MPNKPNNPQVFRFGNIRNRLAKIQIQHGISEFARNILQNEFEAAALYWFIQGGGNEADFEAKFNGK